MPSSGQNAVFCYFFYSRKTLIFPVFTWPERYLRVHCIHNKCIENVMYNQQRHLDRSSGRWEEKMKELDYSQIGKRIRQVRKIKDWSQDELAKKCGISMSFLGHIERGTRIMSL